MKTVPKTSINNNNACYRCGRLGHYASSCYARTNIDGEYIDDSDDDDIDDSDDDDIDDDEYEDDIVCYRCGRPGHYASSCYARTNIDGILINNFISNKSY